MEDEVTKEGEQIDRLIRDRLGQGPAIAPPEPVADKAISDWIRTQAGIAPAKEGNTDGK